MFEDATFDACGAVRNDAPRWMMLTAAANVALVAGLMVAPLLYSRSLPPADVKIPMYTPMERVKLPEQAATQSLPHIAMTMPIPMDRPRIDTRPRSDGPAPDIRWSDIGGGSWEGSNAGRPDGLPQLGAGQSHPMVKLQTPAITRVSSGVVEGLLLPHAQPAYPQIARAAHVEGDAVLGAVISAEGRVEQLHVVSGNPLLRDGAVQAVKDWRYRPYLLNGKPMEVETTITIRFSLHGR